MVKKRQISISLDRDHIEALNVIAEHTKQSFSQTLRHILRRGLSGGYRVISELGDDECDAIEAAIKRIMGGQK